MNTTPMNPWQRVTATLVQGHRVASGLNNNPRFPGGTLRMQIPHFQARGFDLSAYHLGTLNVSIAPKTYRALAPRFTFRDMKWHPTEPAEDFSLFDARLVFATRPPIAGFIYHPHPETKPEHFQKPDVLELLFPFIEGLRYGESLTLEIPDDQMRIEGDRTNTKPADTDTSDDVSKNPAAGF